VRAHRYNLSKQPGRVSCQTLALGLPPRPCGAAVGLRQGLTRTLVPCLSAHSVPVHTRRILSPGVATRPSGSSPGSSAWYQVFST